MKTVVCILLVSLVAVAVSADGSSADGAPDNAAELTVQDGTGPQTGAVSDGMVVAYQTGAFLIRANAERLIAKLGEQDFVGDLYQKLVHGHLYWVVAVAASTIPFENRQAELLDAGFASFPIRKLVLESQMKAVADQ